jgi:hypothetical protein
MAAQLRRRRVIYAYDTEFLEDGTTIELISIGIVAEDGREYYAINAGAPWKRINRHDWLRKNVLPSLPRIHGDRRLQVSVRRNPAAIDFDHPHFKVRSLIAAEVRDFLLGGGGTTELWADYCAYDHVALCQLFGTMMDLPTGIPMWTHDLQYALQAAGDPDLPEQADGHHNALADARHLMASLRILEMARPASPNFGAAT